MEWEQGSSWQLVLGRETEPLAARWEPGQSAVPSTLLPASLGFLASL